MKFKISQLDISSKSANNLTKFHIFEPDKKKELLAGKLFILFDISNANKERSNFAKHVNYVISEINDAYYNNEKLILRERISTLTPEHIFELALSRLNNKFNDKKKDNEFYKFLRDINITICVIFDNEIFYTNHGKNKILLVYKSKKEEISDINEQKEKYKITNITKQADNDNHPINNSKFFSNVICGQIPSQGSLVIANEAFTEYISNEQITNIVSILPPISATEQFKTLLNKINSFISFSAIVIKKHENEIFKDNTKLTKNDSIVDLSKTEDSTEKLLTPSGIINVKNWLNIPKLLNNFNLNNKKANDNLAISNNQRNIWRKINKVIKNILINILNIFYYVILTIYKTSKNLFQAIRKGDKDHIAFIASKQKTLLLSLFALFTLIFLFNVSITKINNNKIEEEANFNEVITEIEKLQNLADSSLLYNNDNKVIETLGEIEKLINQLPDNYLVDNDLSYILDKQKEHLDKVRKIKSINTDSLALISDFSEFNTDSKPINLNADFDNSTIFLPDKNNKNIYSLNLKDNSFTSADDSNVIINNLDKSVIYNNTVFFLNGDNILELNEEDNKLSQASINLIGNFTEYTSIDAYSRYIYLLHPNSNQIYKYSKTTADSYGDPNKWISEDADLSIATDLFIDGNIYILFKNGEVKKYSKGQEIDSAQYQIDPEFTDANTFYISDNLKYLYILESKTNRIGVFDKTTHELLLQYQSDELNDLKDFTVDEELKVMYLLNGTKLLRYNNPEHFNL